MGIKEDIVLIKSRISQICLKNDIELNSISIVAVTKTVEAKFVEKAILNGITDIGESKIQEAESKFEELKGSLKNIRKHMIGHLQTNKVKRAVQMFDLIHSVDSERLLSEINKRASETGKCQDCLLELKVSDEESKYGLSFEDAKELYLKFRDKKNIKIIGFMAMAPYFDNSENARPYFKRAKEYFDSVKSKYGPGSINVLSMGMSGDYDIALEEGSNMVRIGSAIFGKREYN